MEVEPGGQGLPKVFSPKVIIRDGKVCLQKVFSAASWVFCEPYAQILPTANDVDCEVLDLSKPRKHDAGTNHHHASTPSRRCHAFSSSSVPCAVPKTASHDVVPFKKRIHPTPGVGGNHVINKKPAVISTTESLNSDRQSFQSQSQVTFTSSPLPVSSTPSLPSLVSLDEASLCSSSEDFRSPLNSCSTATELPPECLSSRMLPLPMDGFAPSSTPLNGSTSPDHTYHVLKPLVRNTKKESLVTAYTSRHEMRFPDTPCPGLELGRDGVILTANQTKSARTCHRSSVSPAEILNFAPTSTAFLPGQTAETQTGVDGWGSFLATSRMTCGPCGQDVGGYCSEPGDAHSACHGPRPHVQAALEDDSDRLSSHSCPSPSNGRASCKGPILDTGSTAGVQGGCPRLSFRGCADTHAWLAPCPASQTTSDPRRADRLCQQPELRGHHSDDELKISDIVARSFHDASDADVPPSFLSHQKCLDSPKSDRSLRADFACKPSSADPSTNFGSRCAKRVATDPCAIALTRPDSVVQGGNSWTHGDLTFADYREQNEFPEKRQTRKDLLKSTPTDVQMDVVDIAARGRGQPPARRKRPRQKTYPCPLCHVTCSNRGQLLGHLRTHTGERPFPCSEPGCSKTFVRNEELTRHRRIHSGERPYVCATCCKAFTRRDHLNKHLRVHTADLPE